MENGKDRGDDSGKVVEGEIERGASLELERSRKR